MDEFIALGTGITVLITALITLVLTLLNRRLKEVRHLVNSRLDQMVDRVDQLTAALESSDTDVPPPPER